MTFNENALWRDKMNLRLSKLPNTKVLLKLEFDTEDKVLFFLKSTESDDSANFFAKLSQTKPQLKLC